MYNTLEKNIDLEREYLPSYHTTRFQDHTEPNIAVQDHFVAVTSQFANDLSRRSGIKIHNLRYGGTDDRQVVDVYHKEDVGTGPLFVNVHGGYWQVLDKSNACGIVEPLIKRGYRVAVMDYNNCPQVTLEQLLEQFKNFLLWIFDYAERTQTSEIHFAGHSAGAHLIAQLLHMPHLLKPEQRQKVGHIFFICGVYDLRELWPIDGVNPNNIFGLNADSARALSPMLWPWHSNSSSWAGTQSHVLSAEHESVTFIEQSRMFAQNLQDAKFSVIFKIFDKYDHFDIIEDFTIDNSDITKYLLDALQH